LRVRLPVWLHDWLHGVTRYAHNTPRA
jgi:hypothetical protein